MFEKFVFDGISSDEYNVVCVSFDLSSKKTYETQRTELKTENTISTGIYRIISQEYSDPLKYTMQIVNRDGSPISQAQERELNKWLCKRGNYSSFCVLEKRYADIWFYANISNPKIIYIGDVIGLEYTITTNAPFAFSDEKNVTILFDHDDTFTQYVDNDEEIPIYPDMSITLKESGDFELINKLGSGINDNIFSVKNCSAGEILTIDYKYPLISSSNPSHNIYNDFNKNWFYLTDKYNLIHSNLSCIMQLKYREYRKVGLV